MPASNTAELQAYIDEYEEAIATFARLQEELTELRDNTPLPEAAGRLECMLRFNAECLQAFKNRRAFSLGREKYTEPREYATTFGY